MPQFAAVNASQRIRRGFDWRGPALSDDIGTVRLAGEGMTLEASRSGDRLFIPASVTATMPPGRYAIEAERDDDGLSTPFGLGHVDVERSIKADGAFAVSKSASELLLEKAEAALAQAADGAQIAFSANNTSYSFETRGDLQSFVNRLKYAVAKEQGRVRKETRWAF